MYFVLALGMYPRLGYARVWDKLTAELAGLVAGLTVLSAKVAAWAEGIAEGEYLDRIVRLWTDSPR